MRDGRMGALVVGAGLMGRWHGHAIRRAGHTVAGVVDLNLARAGALAARHRGAAAFADLDEGLAALTPRTVHVCTPLESHSRLIHIALESGCHVLAEKPLAESAAHVRSLFAHAAAAERLLVPVHQFGWQRAFRLVRARLAELGPIVQIEMGTASAGASREGSGDPDTVAAEILPHFLTLAHRLIDHSLAAGAWTVLRPRPGEWRVFGHCAAVPVHFTVSMSGRPTFAELRVIGERASVHVDLFHDFAVFERGAVSRRRKVIRPFSLASRTLTTASWNLLRRAVHGESAYPGLTALVQNFYLAAGGRAENPIPPDEVLDVMETWDRLREVAANVVLP